MLSHTFFLADENATKAFAQRMAPLCAAPLRFYFSGDLGAGKSTFIRAFLREKGIEGAIKSPTFTLIEPYQHHDQQFFHVDLYRMEDELELEFIGLHEYFTRPCIGLIEWAEKGEKFLPKPDLYFRLSTVNSGREIELIAHSVRGEQILLQLIKE